MTHAADASISSPPDLDQRFEAARTAIVGRRLQDLPSERLMGIVERLGGEMRQEVAELERLRGLADAALNDHDWSTFDRVRTRALDVASRYESLQTQRDKVSDLARERRLAEKVEARLGSRRRVMVLDGVIMALIVLVVTLLMIQILAPLSEQTHMILELIDVVVCFLFLGEFFWRMRLADSKRWFWRRYWLDFVTSIPIPASLLRAGRIVRLARLARMIRLIRLLRIIRTILFFWRGMDQLAAAMDVSMMRRSLKLLVTVLVLGGVGIWYLEGHSSVAGVENVGQGLWWSFTTVVTGGFGDIHNPQTWTGRVLTVALIIAGMVVVGIFTATLTSVLVREEDTTAAVLAMDEKLTGELETIRAQLRSLSSAQTVPPRPEPSGDAPAT
ncbi:MAG: potassium channel family protein [Myxococcota bacterium]